MLRSSCLSLLLWLLLLSQAATAQIRSYAIDPAQSEVRFTFMLNGAPLSGTLPIDGAQIGIDFANVRNTTARVTLNAARARTGLLFATEALRSPSVLHTGRHPKIRFVSKRTIPTPQGARIEGDLTLRGVTRTVRLNARFAQAPGARPADRSRLTILLTGTINRSAFGATGYANLVEDPVQIRIQAALRRLD